MHLVKQAAKVPCAGADGHNCPRRQALASLAALAALAQQASPAHADLPPSEAEVFDKLRNNLDQFPAGQPGSKATAQGRRDLAEDAGDTQQVSRPLC